jgi:tetratricopeptide (TPR) repeat protein
MSMASVAVARTRLGFRSVSRLWVRLAAGSSLVVVVLSGYVLGRATDSPSSGTTSSVKPVATRAAPTGTSTSATENQIDVLRRQQDNLDRYIDLALLPLAVLTAVLGAGGAVGIVLSFRNETRSGQIHDLQVAGESAQQARTEESHAVLLDASQKTLTLVNETLELARDASERASKALSERARRLLREISEDASTLFERALYSDGFKTQFYRTVTEDAHARNEILDLSQRLASIEGYLEFQEIPLTASAFMLKGLSHHLRQDETRSIRYFDSAIDSRDATDKFIEPFAHYWMGHACSNAGQYRRAADAFNAAYRVVGTDSAEAFELARLATENTFYGVVETYLANRTGSVVPLVEQTRQMIALVSRRAQRAKTLGRADVLESLYRTQGNMHTWLARVTDAESPEAERAWSDAVDAFKLAVDAREVESRHLWSRFGLQEALRAQRLHGAEKNSGAARTPGAAALAESEESRKIYQELELAADELTQHRSEPRSKVLLLLAIVICMDRQDKVSDLAFAKRQLRHAFSEVDGAITLYSERLKANVTRQQFEDEELKPLHVLDVDDQPAPDGDGRAARDA